MRTGLLSLVLAGVRSQTRKKERGDFAAGLEPPARLARSGREPSLRLYMSASQPKWCRGMQIGAKGVLGIDG